MRALIAALIVCLFSVPSFAAKQPRVLLVLTYVMPRDEPDIRTTEPMESMDECWGEAKRFVEHGVPKAIKDKTVAVMAGCLRSKIEEDDL